MTVEAVAEVPLAIGAGAELPEAAAGVEELPESDMTAAELSEADAEAAEEAATLLVTFAADEEEATEVDRRAVAVCEATTVCDTTPVVPGPTLQDALGKKIPVGRGIWLRKDSMLDGKGALAVKRVES